MRQFNKDDEMSPFMGDSRCRNPKHTHTKRLLPNYSNASTGHFQVLRYFKIKHWRHRVKVVISIIPVSGQSVHFLPELRAALHNELHTLETSSGRSVVEGEGAWPLASRSLQRGQAGQPRGQPGLRGDRQRLGLLFPLPQQPSQNIQTAVPANSGG